MYVHVNVCKNFRRLKIPRTSALMIQFKVETLTQLEFIVIHDDKGEILSTAHK